MKIAIAERLRPYSHFPGGYYLLPGSFFRLQIFPTLIRVYDLSKSDPQLVKEFDLPVQGPIQQFTVMNDLEKGCISVWGHALQGYFRYRIHSQDHGRSLAIIEEKSPNEVPLFKEAHSLDLIDTPPVTSRLSLGNQKAPEWELIERRLDLTEILPHWNRLGQILPPLTLFKREGTACLLDACEEAIESNSPETIVPGFLNLFKTGFCGLLTPRLIDDQHQGIVQTKCIDNRDLSPLILLTEGSVLIRKLFVQQKDREIRILPALPPEFHSGRFLEVALGELGSVDFEWSKKRIRRLIFRSEVEGEVRFIFKHAKSCRVKEKDSKKALKLQIGNSVAISKNLTYFFDNFE